MYESKSRHISVNGKYKRKNQYEVIYCCYLYLSVSIQRLMNRYWWQKIKIYNTTQYTFYTSKLCITSVREKVRQNLRTDSIEITPQPQSWNFRNDKKMYPLPTDIATQPCNLNSAFYVGIRWKMFLFMQESGLLIDKYSSWLQVYLWRLADNHNDLKQWLRVMLSTDNVAVLIMLQDCTEGWNLIAIWKLQVNTRH